MNASVRDTFPPTALATVIDLGDVGQKDTEAEEQDEDEEEEDKEEKTANAVTMNQISGWLMVILYVLHGTHFISASGKEIMFRPRLLTRALRRLVG